LGRRPGCVDGFRRKTESGNVLIVLLGAVFVLAILGSAVFEIGDAARERALKLEDRDRAMGGIEFGMEAVRQTVAREFESQAWVDVAGLGGKAQLLTTQFAFDKAEKAYKAAINS
jgi:hypothetical protein